MSSSAKARFDYEPFNAHAASIEKLRECDQALRLAATKAAEERVTDPRTGGQKGTKAAKFGLLPWLELAEVAEHYAKGAKKYSAHNWRKGYSWSLSFDALQRHLAAYWEGEDIDAETGSCHLAAAAFHVLALMHFRTRFPQLDDRYKPVNAAKV